jgi:hypothetical protein
MDKFEQLRLLRIFLCHSSDDKAVVRDLYDRLLSDGMQPWLDEKNMLPGQDWELEIRKAVKNTDVVIVCLSKSSINKRGFVQKEIKLALDVADEQPEGTIFLIPFRLDPCDVPQRLQSIQWVDYFEPGGYLRLIAALKKRSDELSIPLLPRSDNKVGEMLRDLFDNAKEVRRNFVNAFKSLSPGEFTKNDQYIFDLYIANGDGFLLIVEKYLSDLDRLKYQMSVYAGMGKTKPPQSKREVYLVQSRWIIGWLFKSRFIKKDGDNIEINEHMKKTFDNLISFLKARNRFSKRDEIEAKTHVSIIEFGNIRPD